MTKSAVHRGQTALCAAFTQHLDNEIWAKNQRDRVANVEQMHRRLHSEMLAKARAARADGALHARLMRSAWTARLYFTQCRLVRI